MLCALGLIAHNTQPYWLKALFVHTRAHSSLRHPPHLPHIDKKGSSQHPLIGTSSKDNPPGLIQIIHKGICQDPSALGIDPGPTSIPLASAAGPLALGYRGAFEPLPPPLSHQLGSAALRAKLAAAREISGKRPAWVTNKPSGSRNWPRPQAEGSQPRLPVKGLDWRDPQGGSKAHPSRRRPEVSPVGGRSGAASTLLPQAAAGPSHLQRKAGQWPFYQDRKPKRDPQSAGQPVAIFISAETAKWPDP